MSRFTFARYILERDVFPYVLPRTHLDTCGREVAGFLAVKLPGCLFASCAESLDCLESQSEVLYCLSLWHSLHFMTASIYRFWLDG